jgi:hypothetical protein
LFNVGESSAKPFWESSKAGMISFVRDDEIWEVRESESLEGYGDLNVLEVTKVYSFERLGRSEVLGGK